MVPCVNRRHVSIRKDLHAIAQPFADARGASMSVLVELALVELLESFKVPDSSRARSLLNRKHLQLLGDRPCAHCLGTGTTPAPEAE